MSSEYPAPWQRLSWRVFSGTAALVLVLLVAVLLLATTSARRAAREGARASLERSADLVAQLLAGRARSLAGGARVFVQGPYFRTLVAERRRDDILDQTFEAADQLDASWVFITDATGTLIAKSDEPSAFGESMSAVPLVSGALRGQMTSGFGGSGDSLLFQTTAVPIAAPGGMPFGVLVATRVLDSSVATDIAQSTNQSVVFYVLDGRDGLRLAASSLAGDSAVRGAVEVALANRDGGSGHFTVTAGERTLQGYRTTLTTAGGTPVGGYVVLQPADLSPAVLAPVRRSLLFAALLGLACALVAGALTARLVARPVADMAAQVRRLAEFGDVERSASVAGASRFASAELTALAGAIDTLVQDAEDESTVRALMAAMPTAEGGSRSPARPAGRALAFRASATRTPGWQVGAVVANRYVLEAEMGRGPTGLLFRARDLSRGQTVAVRVLRDGGTADANASRPFGAGEVPAMQVVQRHLVRVLDAGEMDGTRFVSCEYVDGLSLSELLERHGALPPPAVVAVARQLLRGVGALHAAGTVHGGLTPRAVLVSFAGVVRITDVGLFQLTPRDSHNARTAAVAYRAPELLIGATESAASDIFALGRLLEGCLVGGLPQAASLDVQLGAQLSPWPLTAPAATDERSGRGRARGGGPGAGASPASSSGARYADVSALVARMTHPDASRRPQSTDDLLADWNIVAAAPRLVR